MDVASLLGVASSRGKNPNADKSFPKKLAKNIVSEPTSGSKALAAFLSGEGDVVIGYEDDIMEAAKSNLGKVKLIVPSSSLLIENPISWTLKPAPRNQALAKKVCELSPHHAGATHLGEVLLLASRAKRGEEVQIP